MPDKRHSAFLRLPSLGLHKPGTGN
jgi:hypothetical protein